MAEDQQRAIKVGFVVVGGSSDRAARAADLPAGTSLVLWDRLAGAARATLGPACMREPIAGGQARSASPWEPAH